MKANFFVAMSAILFLVACPSKKNQSQDNRDLVTYRFDEKLQLRNNVEVPGAIEDLVNKVNSQQPLSFMNLTQLKIQQEAKEFFRLNEEDIVRSNDMTPAALEQLMNAYLSTSTHQYAKEITEFKHLGEQKVKYEDMAIKKINAEQAADSSPISAQNTTTIDQILYNKAAVTALHPIISARLQCYSGSSLNLLVNRQRLAGQDYHNEHFVVVMTAGHILVGEMIKKGDEWALRSTETTASDDGTDETLAKDLSTDAHVYMATDFFLIDVLKNYLEFSSSDLIGSLRRSTAERYGIPLPEAMVASGAQNVRNNSPLSASNKDKAHNWSPFAFGSVDVPEGDIERRPSNGIGGRALRAGARGQQTETEMIGQEEWEIIKPDRRPELKEEPRAAGESEIVIVFNPGSKPGEEADHWKKYLLNENSETALTRPFLASLRQTIDETLEEQAASLDAVAESSSSINRGEILFSANPTAIEFWQKVRQKLKTIYAEKGELLIPLKEASDFFNEDLNYVDYCKPELVEDFISEGSAALPLAAVEQDPNPKEISNRGLVDEELIAQQKQTTEEIDSLSPAIRGIGVYLAQKSNSCTSIGQALTYLIFLEAQDKGDGSEFLNSFYKDLTLFISTETDRITYPDFTVLGLAIKEKGANKSPSTYYPLQVINSGFRSYRRGSNFLDIRLVLARRLLKALMEQQAEANKPSERELN